MEVKVEVKTAKQSGLFRFILTFLSRKKYNLDSKKL